MRALFLALIAFAFPAHALASTPVPYAQCAPYTVKALEEGRVRDIAALFSTPGKALGDRQAEIADQLTTILGKAGSLSDSKPVAGMLPIATIKLEARDPGASGDAPNLARATHNLAKVTHTVQTAKLGVVLLNVTYHKDQADCELFTVNIQMLMPDSMMLITFDTCDQKAFDAFTALLAEKKIAYTVTTTETDPQKTTQWKIETISFPVNTISAADELFNSVSKATAKLSGRLAFSSTYGSKPHTKP